MKWRPKTFAEYCEFLLEWCLKCGCGSFKNPYLATFGVPDIYPRETPEIWIVAEDGRPCCLAFESGEGEAAIRKYHIAISLGGVFFRVGLKQSLPEGWVRIDPDIDRSQIYFNSDGSLKERFSRLPIYKKGETE